MSGPQTAQARATLAASPSNVGESACRKARSRVPAVLHSAISAACGVSGRSASRARSSTGIVRVARPRPPRHPQTAPHPASIGAIDPKPRRSTRWCATISRPCSVPSTMGRLPCASRSMPGRNSSPTSTAGFSVAQASRSRLCPTEMPCLWRNPAGGLPVVHGAADECHGRKSDRTRAAAFNPPAAVGADLPVLVEAEARPGRRIARPTHPDLRG